MMDTGRPHVPRETLGPYLAVKRRKTLISQVDFHPLAEVIRVQESFPQELAARQEVLVVGLPILPGALRCLKSRACRQAAQGTEHRILHSQ
jgi:hypothetical protein